MPTRRASSDVSHQEDAGCRLDLVRPDDRQIVRDAYREFVTRDVDIAILSVCLSVRLSHSGIVSKRFNVS